MCTCACAAHDCGCVCVNTPQTVNTDYFERQLGGKEISQ